MIFEIIYVVRVRVGERAACRRQASPSGEASRREAQRKRDRRGVGTCTEFTVSAVELRLVPTCAKRCRGSEAEVSRSSRE